MSRHITGFKWMLRGILIMSIVITVGSFDLTMFYSVHEWNFSGRISYTMWLVVFYMLGYKLEDKK